MRFLGYYCLLSLFVGIVKAAWIIFQARKDFLKVINESDTRSGKRLIEEQVAAGHIQKEVYGERVVYYRKDLSGEAAVKTVDLVSKFRRTHRTLYAITLVVVGVILNAISWPRDLYRYIREL